ncbi:DUF4339 domain-containing protein [Thermopirellula anaerolimosa]
MSTQETYHIRVRGNVLGPFRREQLLKMIDRGQLTRMHEVSCDGSDWQPAGSREELFPQPPAPPAAAPATTESVAASFSISSNESEPGQSTAWYYEYDGRENGPVPASQLIQLIAKGLVGPENRVWKEGMKDWQPVHATELAAHLPPQVAAPPRSSITGRGYSLAHAAPYASGFPSAKPKVPGIIHAAWILYVVSALLCLSGVLVVAVISRNQSLQSYGVDHDAIEVVGIVLLSLSPLGILEIVSVIFVVLGYAWGAVVQIVTFTLGVPFIIGIIGSGFSVSPLVGVLWVLWFIGSLARFICFMVPPAWDYYRACKAYRLNRLLAERPDGRPFM